MQLINLTRNAVVLSRYEQMEYEHEGKTLSYTGKAGDITIPPLVPDEYYGTPAHDNTHATITTTSGRNYQTGGENTGFTVEVRTSICDYSKPSTPLPAPRQGVGYIVASMFGYEGRDDLYMVDDRGRLYQSKIVPPDLHAYDDTKLYTYLERERARYQAQADGPAPKGDRYDEREYDGLMAQRYADAIALLQSLPFPDTSA